MVCEATLWVGSGLLQVIEELRKPGWIVQKQPAHHCLKPCGPSIHSGISAPRTTACTVVTPTHPIQFLGIQEFTVFQPAEEPRLSISADIGHTSPMEVVRTPGLRSMAQPLMQLPNGISDPSQLQRPQLVVDDAGSLIANPVAQAASWFRAVGRSSTK